MLVKEHQANGKLILAIADKELINKKFIEKNKQLDLTTGFYKGEEKNRKEVLELINKSYIVNAVGEKIVSLLLKEKLISEENIIYVCKVPHTQLVILREER